MVMHGKAQAGWTVTGTTHALAPEQDSDLAMEELEARWRTAVRDRLADMDLRPTVRGPGVASFERQDIGDLLMTRWVCPASEGTRRSAHVRRDVDALAVFTASAGTQFIETPHGAVVLRPGALLIMSSRTTGTFVIPDRLTKRTVRVPWSALAPYDTGGGAPGCLFLDVDRDPLARLTYDFLASLDRERDRMSPAEIECARTTLLVLIAGMLRAEGVGDVGEADFLPVLRNQMEVWIVDHLAAGAIRVRDLAAAHGVSPRTVHRAFSATGDTVGSIVRARRLVAARADIVNTTWSITAIAHRWGFSDASHFGRQFRREYALTPSDYREAHGIA